MKHIGFISFISAVCFAGCAADEYCSLFLSCSYGYYCCNFYTQCCASILTTGAIIGIVVGCIGFLGVIGCVIAVICCIIKKKNHQGQIIRPHQPQNTMTVVSTGNNSQQYGQQPYGQPSYGQPSYGQQPFGQPQPLGPPAYGTQPNKAGFNQPGQDMVYPPPPPVY